MKKRHPLKWVAGSKTPPKVYITRVFNFGTLEEWRDMKKRFPRRIIEDALQNPLRGQWTSDGKRFAEVIYGIRMPHSVLISYDA